MPSIRNPFPFRLMTVLLTAAAFGLAASSIAHAQASQVISLKDGSTVQGKILQLVDGVYTVETQALGKISIRESDVLSVRAQGAPPSPGSSGAKEQIAQIQNNIMADPDMMAEIQNLTQDEEIMAILSDPDLFNALSTQDVQKIEGNAKFQKLLNNPKMQALAEKLQQKSLAPSPAR